MIWQYVLLGLALVFACLSFAQWRWGIVLMILLAAVQDPMRKMVPGTAGWLVLATAPIFIAMIFSSMVHQRGWWHRFGKPYPRIAKAMLILLPLIFPAVILSATYGPGSWMYTLFGVFSYSLILLAIVAGFHFARDEKALRAMLAAYCLINGVMLTGGIFQFYNWFPNSPILGSDMFGYKWVRWADGYTVDMIAGFYRSADVMGWHAASVCILSFVLALSSGKGIRRYAWAALSAFAVVALLLCGRRKMVYMLPVFALALVWINWQAGRAARAVAILGLLMIPLLAVYVTGDVISEDSANMRYYSGKGLRMDAADSIQGEGFASVMETFRQSGFFGEGIGFATPGAHNLSAAHPRIWQESAPSRIMVELGVPGMAGFLFVMLCLGLAMWRTTLAQVRARTTAAPIAAGLFAYFLANVGSLTVSGQILADPFIASFLGFLSGAVLSIPRLQATARARAEARAMHLAYA